MNDLDLAIFRASNRANVKLWVAALRSGNYVQTDGALRKLIEGSSTPRFCCLGVATEVAIMHNAVNLRAAGPDEGEDGGGYVSSTDATNWRTENGSLPDGVRAWLGFESPNPIIARIQGEGAVEATGANDSLHWDFNRIADEVEYTYMLNFNDAQIIAATREMVKRGNNIVAERILAMLLRERSTTKVTLPEPPVRPTKDDVVLT